MSNLFKRNWRGIQKLLRYKIFGSGLKSQTQPTNEKRKFYTFIDSSKFAQAIMDAYMTSMNEVSKKLDNQVSKETYSKQEVIEIVFEAFNSAKTIGEGQIQNSK